MLQKDPRPQNQKAKRQRTIGDGSNAADDQSENENVEDKSYRDSAGAQGITDEVVKISVQCDKCGERYKVRVPKGKKTMKLKCGKPECGNVIWLEA